METKTTCGKYKRRFLGFLTVRFYKKLSSKHDGNVLFTQKTLDFDGQVPFIHVITQNTIDREYTKTYKKFLNE